MKTLSPMIVTARVAEADMAPFNRLRKTHFPLDRNVLQAHLTMFHRLPGEYVERIVTQLEEAAGQAPFTAEVSGVRHLGAGVAFTIASPELHALRRRLASTFMPWLGGQDMQKWQPHITIQNKAAKAAADALHKALLPDFRPHAIGIVGIDLWRYLDGPWRHEACAPLGGPAMPEG